MCCGEAGEKEKESARGTMGRGKREERPHVVTRSHALEVRSLIAELHAQPHSLVNLPIPENLVIT